MTRFCKTLPVRGQGSPVHAKSARGDRSGDAAYPGGSLAMQKRDFNPAFTEVLQLTPMDVSAYTCRVNAFKLKGQYAKTVSHYKDAVRLLPKRSEGAIRIVTADTYNVLAWILATCPDATPRDGKKGFQCAQISCDLTKSTDPTKFDARAAAYAEAGNFAEAVRWQK